MRFHVLSQSCPVLQVVEVASPGLLTYSIVDTLTAKELRAEELDTSDLYGTRYVVAMCERVSRAREISSEQQLLSGSRGLSAIWPVRRRCEHVDVCGEHKEVFTSRKSSFLQLAQFRDANDLSGVRTFLARYPPAQVLVLFFD